MVNPISGAHYNPVIGLINRLGLEIMAHQSLKQRVINQKDGVEKGILSTGKAKKMIDSMNRFLEITNMELHCQCHDELD